MKKNLLLVLPLLLVGMTLVGCPKKPPKTSETPTAAPVAPVPTAPTTDVRADARPDTGTDQVQVDPLKDPDLARLNGYVRERGLLGDVFFDLDRAELRAEARERLARNAEWLKSHPEFQVTIEGHCDDRGTNEYNLALGERRASSARDYLVSLGVAAARVRILSYGEERPVCTQQSESCWAQNRRAHFLVTGRSNVG
jgi:peptidoglycan-associated lipoprotein